MQPLWIPIFQDKKVLSPTAIHSWALIGALVNLAFVGLVRFCT